MEIIDRLEVSRRGLYAASSAISTSPAIRHGDRPSGRLSFVTASPMFQAGAGVVADSIPANEDAESVNKAAAVLGAVVEAADCPDWSPVPEIFVSIRVTGWRCSRSTVSMGLVGIRSSTV